MKKKGCTERNVLGGRYSKKGQNGGRTRQRSERNGEGDHRSLLIDPDYKVRLRLNDMGKSYLSSFSLFPHLIV